MDSADGELEVQEESSTVEIESLEVADADWGTPLWHWEIGVAISSYSQTPYPRGKCQIVAVQSAADCKAV